MADDDPDFKGKENLFEPVEVAARRPAEQAAGVGGAVDAAVQPDTGRRFARGKG